MDKVKLNQNSFDIPHNFQISGNNAPVQQIQGGGKLNLRDEYSEILSEKNNQITYLQKRLEDLLNEKMQEQKLVYQQLMQDKESDQFEKKEIMSRLI